MASNKVCCIDGRFYLYKRESYWDPVAKKSRQRNSTYIGPCDKEGNLLKPARPRVESVHSSFPVGALSIFYAAAQDLKIRENIEQTLGVSRPVASLVLSMALNQVVGRQPVSHLADWTLRSPLKNWENLDPENVHRDSYLESLSALCHPMGGGIDNPGLELQRVLNDAWRQGSREPAAVYYDVTKQPYYGTDCPFAALGHDSTGGLSTVVGFGLVTSRDHHHPVLCRPILGSKNDTLGVRDTVNHLKDFGFEHLMMVIDRGMVSEENIKSVTSAGYDQLGIVRGWNKESWDYVTQWPQEKLEQPQFVVERSSGEVAYCRAWTASLFGRAKMRVAVVESSHRACQEREARDLALKQLMQGNLSPERLRQIRAVLNDVVEASPGRHGFHVNEKAMAEADKGLGRFLMFSTDLSMDAEEMFHLYFQRDAIEKVFETMKGELSLGPIRYRRADRLEAYATVVYVAYLLWSWAERKLKENLTTMRTLRKKYTSLSLARALDIVEGVSWVRFGTGKSIRDWTTRLTEEQEEILKSLGATRYLPVS